MARQGNKSCSPRQPVRHQVATDVLATFCYPCLRAGQGWRRGRSRGISV